MKIFVQRMVFIHLSVLIAFAFIRGQNVVQNGSFEDDSAWQIYNGGTTDEVEYTFPYTGDIPAHGSGSACLNAYGMLTTGEWINGLIWQEMDLEPGTTYVLDAAWKYLDGDVDGGSWFQIYVSEEAPEDGVDWTPAGGTHSDRMFSFNSWSGCSGLEVDGTFMDDACEANHTALYRAPAEDVPVYIGLKAGAGWGGTEFDILIDDINLRPNLIVNGDFEDETGWTIYDGGASGDYEVIVSDDSDLGPALGHNNYLRMRGNANGDWCNGLVWQELELVGGKTYAFNAGFRWIAGTLSAGSWIQVYLSQEAPVDSVDWAPPAGDNTDVLIGFNSWSGCGGDSVDGTFRSYGCDGQDTTLYTAPGADGEVVTVYFGIKAGCGWGGDSLHITIDDVSLVLVEEGAASGVEVNPVLMAANYALQQNYPNPFNPSTTIHFSIPVKQKVNLSVYDIMGRKVKTLINESMLPGKHAVQWHGQNERGAFVSSGIYFYKIEAGKFSQTKKLLYVQ
jgi:hypothetical protein